MEKKEVTSSS